jgi:hypothetical protein
VSNDVGDRVNVRYLAFAAGVPSTATVVLSVTAPDGTTSTPAVTPTAPNIYDASFLLSTAGNWSWEWTVTGTVEDVEFGAVYAAAAPGPPQYATLAELRGRVGMGESATTVEDVRLSNALEAASRGIDGVCSRSFGLAPTATPRVYYPETYWLAKVDDFVSVTEIATDSGDGTYATVWAAADYQLEPLNGVVDGESGWPFWTIRAILRSFPCVGRMTRAPLRVTARWGWQAVPENVHEGCLILATEIYSLKDLPFGVGGYGQFGIIKARQNPMVMARVGKYVRDAVLVG